MELFSMVSPMMWIRWQHAKWSTLSCVWAPASWSWSSKELLDNCRAEECSISLADSFTNVRITRQLFVAMMCIMPNLAKIWKVNLSNDISQSCKRSELYFLEFEISFEFKKILWFLRENSNSKSYFQIFYFMRENSNWYFSDFRFWREN